MSKKISLVLGWWACKWFIHLWVYRYLEEHEYTIKEVAGTSMWAIIWSMIAAGKTYKEIYQCAKGLSYKKIIDKNLTQGIIQWKKIIKVITDMIAVTDFDELPIPLSITATDIDSGACIMSNSGDLADAIRGSISLPGLFSVHTNNEWKHVVDGWLVNNLPVDLIQAKHPVIAVSCLGIDNYTTETTTTIFGREIDTSLFTLGSRVVYRSLDIMMAKQEDANLNNQDNVTLIRPPLNDINPFKLSVLDEAIEIGYQEAKKVIGWN